MRSWIFRGILMFLLAAQGSAGIVMATEMQLSHGLLQSATTSPTASDTVPCPHHAGQGVEAAATPPCCDDDNPTRHCHCVGAGSLMPAQPLAVLPQLTARLHTELLIPAVPSALPQRLLRPPRQ